jgi:hypothetical protein
VSRDQFVELILRFVSLPKTNWFLNPIGRWRFALVFVKRKLLGVIL